MSNLLWVALGGSLGSVLRLLINNAFPFNGSGFPKATFIVNILASFILGVVTASVLAKFPNQNWLKYFVLVGFCGAFSTFSTFALEIYNLGITHIFLNTIYILSSIAISVIAIALGFYIVKII